jgi:ubiquinone/menaquinone biosynthesis C-methylase UbiE
VSLGHALLRQCSKPSGWLGRMNLRNMNRRHAKLTAWGLTHLAVQPTDVVLDIGCGGGKTIARLAAMANAGKIYGIDYSPTSVATSRETNLQLIAEGRADIREGSVSRLPFPDATFNVVTAVETHYYWPRLIDDVREVRRVVAPGGTFAIIAESYRGGKRDRMLSRLDELQKRGVMPFAHLSVGEHRQLLVEAGFSDVTISEEYDKNWICAVGTRR